MRLYLCWAPGTSKQRKVISGSINTCVTLLVGYTYVKHCRNIRLFSFQVYLIFPSVFSFDRELLSQPLRSDSSALFYILLRDFLLFVFLSLSGVFLYLYAQNERESFDISFSSPFRGFRPIWSFRHRVSSCCITTHTRYLQSDLIFSLFYPFWIGQEALSLRNRSHFFMFSVLIVHKLTSVTKSRYIMPIETNRTS